MLTRASIALGAAGVLAFAAFTALVVLGMI